MSAASGARSDEGLASKGSSTAPATGTLEVAVACVIGAIMLVAVVVALQHRRQRRAHQNELFQRGLASAIGTPVTVCAGYSDEL